MRGWFDVKIEEGGAKCSPLQCQVTATLNIPPTLQSCYDSYTIQYIQSEKQGNPFGSGSKDFQSQPDPIPADGILRDVNYLYRKRPFTTVYSASL